MQNFKVGDKSIERYYTEHPPIPKFAYSDTLGRKIFYAESGDTTKPLLLLIHGAPGAWHGYLEYLSDSSLAKNFHIIAPDRPGYNNSGPSETSVEKQAILLEPLLHHNNGQKVIVLGRSYGSAIAARMAMNFPKEVDNLILVAPACSPYLEKFWWFSKPVNSKFFRFFLPEYANRASDEKFVHANELKKMLPLWQKISCPVTIIQGGKDWIIDPKNGAFVDSALVNAPHHYIYLPEDSHLLTKERPDVIKKAILETIKAD